MHRVVLHMWPTVDSTWFAGHAYGIGICFVREGDPESAELAAGAALGAAGWETSSTVEVVEVDADSIDASEQDLYTAALRGGRAHRVELGRRRWIDRRRLVSEEEPAFPVRARFARWCEEIVHSGSALLLYSTREHGYAGSRFLEQDVVPIWATSEELAPWQADWPTHVQPRRVPVAELAAMVEKLEDRAELVAVGLDEALITFAPAAILAHLR